MRKSYRVLFEDPGGKRLLARSRNGWVETIKTGPKKRSFETRTVLIQFRT
jgi:hypothetical protein